MELPVFKAKKSMSEKVADYLKEQIQSGQVSEGERIYGERDMAERLDVSRNTVREAYKILEAYGYLKAEHGRGVFIASEAEQVRKMTKAFFVSKNNINDLYAVRLIFEEKIVEWAIENGSDTQIENLREIVEKSKNVIKNNADLLNLAEYDLEFHLCIAEMSENMVVNRIMHHLIDLLGQARTQSIEIPNRAKKSVLEHEKIFNAIRDRNSIEAKEAMNHHLKSVEKSMRKMMED